jgi:hypothetical protein
MDVAEDAERAIENRRESNAIVVIAQDRNNRTWPRINANEHESG